MLKKFLCCIIKENIVEEPIGYYESEDILYEDIKVEVSNEIEYNKIKYNDKIHTEKECPICLEEFKQDESIVLLPCLHYFHEDCLNAWFKKSTNIECPLCKKKI